MRRQHGEFAEHRLSHSSDRIQPVAETKQTHNIYGFPACLDMIHSNIHPKTDHYINRKLSQHSTLHSQYFDLSCMLTLEICSPTWTNISTGFPAHRLNGKYSKARVCVLLSITLLVQTIYMAVIKLSKVPHIVVVIVSLHYFCWSMAVFKVKSPRLLRPC